MDFAHYWQYTDAVSKTLFFILLALSVVSWVVGVMRLLNSKRMATNIASDLKAHMANKQGEFSALAFAERKLVVEQNLLEQIAHHRFEAEKGLPVLGTTAAIAPFIGLFGTVWGIFHALHSIAKSGQAGLAQVAGPVGEALIMTGLGLAVAIPAVVFYNIATRLNKRAMHTANTTAHQILAQSVR
ncbi:biopolymer transporter ExbB [Moraxella caviae]|uniref:Biopolymer transport protein ExbB n=1 Tax=Moraxella caviae TaxID=34060 RepID=A0A1T0A006_9GAMM|nr:MotA/TolQ/ExbB proton channel family protein [Moraxella caviae]OOR88997.1 biopolymer transporter ExbB [Moraxella caviae]STZ14751.1 colicin uptake protein TolQ [Moraxella caviae]VEW14001.1 colicin uptake protein TolQ [Moraxella caviae]